MNEGTVMLVAFLGFAIGVIPSLFALAAYLDLRDQLEGRK